MNILEYKGFFGTVEIDMTREVCHGKVLLVGDLVRYEASKPKRLRREFEYAVDDYIETCFGLNRK